MRKILAILILLLVPSLAFASILGVQQGGTASSTLTGILMGNGISSIRTVTVGSGLLLSGTTLSSTAAGGTVTNIATTWPIIGGPITTTGTLSLDLSTSTLTATGPLTGSFTQIGSGGSLGIQASSPTQNGYLSLTDYQLLHTASTTFTSPLIYTLSSNAVTLQAASASQIGSMSSGDYQLLHTATTTFSSPLVYTLSTNAVTCPTCIVTASAGGTATTSFAATFPITLSTSPLITYGYNGLSTTSPWTNGRLVMVQGLNQVTSVATSSLTVGTGMSINNAATSFVIGNAPTFSLLSYIATSSAETNGQLAMWATTNGTPAGLRSVATGTISGSGPIGVTAGQSVIGTGLTVSCATCNTSNATVSSITAGTGLGGGTITTSGTIYDTSAVSTSSAETNGQVAYWGTTNGTPAGLRSVATGTVAASGNVTVTAAQSIIGSGLTVTVPWEWSSINVFSTTSIATTTSIYTVGAFFASSTQASQFPYASTTAITATNASTTNLQVSATAIFDAGNVGIGTTTPWGILSVLSPSLTNPIFSVASSTGGSPFFNIFSTTTILQMISTAVNSATPDLGIRIGIGTTNYLGFGGLLDQFVVRGRINTEGWNQSFCDIVSAQGGSAQSNLCGNFAAGSAIASNPVFTDLVSNTGGYAYSSANISATGAAGAGAVFFFANNSGTTGWFTPSTSTPVMEINARIEFPQNSTSTQYYLGFDSNNKNGTMTVTVPTNGCFFTASSTNANWWAVAVSGSTATAIDTGIASSTKVTNKGGFYKFRLEASNNLCTFYMQTAQANPLKTVANITTNIPNNTGLTASVWVTTVTAGATQVSLDFNHFRVWWRDFLPAL